MSQKRKMEDNGDVEMADAVPVTEMEMEFDYEAAIKEFFMTEFQLGDDDNENVKSLYMKAHEKFKGRSNYQEIVQGSLAVGFSDEVAERCVPLTKALSEGMTSTSTAMSVLTQQEAAEAESENAAAMPDLEHATQNNKPRDMLLKRLDSLGEGDTNLAPFLAIVQSSGYGKTRTILEVAKKRRVVYLLCSDISGGLKSPKVANEFLTNIRNKESTFDRERHASKYLAAIVKTADKYETAEELFRAQFTKEGRLNDLFYGHLLDNYKKVKTPTTSPVKWNGKEYSVASDSSSVVTDSSSVNQNQTANDNKPLVVVFDEAVCLTGREGHNNHSPYRCIRRVLKSLKLIGVFLDTSGQLHMFAPEAAASDRDTGIGKFAAPIFEIDTFDQFRNPDDHQPLFLGRPLWKMQWEYRLNKNNDKLVEFAAHKLLPDRCDDGLCALFICRFGLQPVKGLANALVANHMATLVDVSLDRKSVVVHYKSEPILAEASALITSGDDPQEATPSNNPCIVMQKVREKLQASLLECDKGDRGEVAAAAWLGYSLDNVRMDSKKRCSGIHSRLSQEIEVLEFLRAVCPNTEELKENNDTFGYVLAGWKINFTHFCRLGFSPDTSILKKCWDQRVAIYMPEGEEGLDLLITMMKMEGGKEKFATLRVQVKNYKNMITDKAISDLLQKLDARRCAPRTLQNEEPFSIALLIQVGIGGMSHRQACLVTLGKNTRRTAGKPKQKQLQLACTVSGQYEGSIRGIAGDPEDNREYIGSSEAFRTGAWFE
jgi:hypothetical protein